MKELSIKEKIKQIIGEETTYDFATVEKVYDQFSSNEIDPIEGLKCFFELVEDLEFDKQKDQNLLSEDEELNELEVLEGDYRSYVVGFLDTVTRMNLSQVEFYEYIWRFVCSEIFRHNNARCYAILEMSLDVRMPYYNCSNSLEMSQEEYQEICDSVKEYIVNARSVLFTKQKLRTEEASALVDLLEKIEDRKEKSVFLSVIIQMVEMRTKKKNIKVINE